MSFKRIGDDPTALRVQKVCSLLYVIVLRGFVKGVDGIGYYNKILAGVRLQPTDLGEVKTAHGSPHGILFKRISRTTSIIES